MYNLKVKDYGNGQVQTRIYSHLVYTGKKQKSEREKPETDVNPFDGQECIEIDDWDRFLNQHERSVVSSLKRAKNKIYDLSRANEWEYFITLTFSPERVDRYDYSDCTKKLSKWLNHMQTDCNGTLKYLVVPERHKDGAYHFHGLIADCEGLDILPSGHYDKTGKAIYNLGKYKFGFTTATRVEVNAAVTKYITKYTTKDLMEHTKNKKKYWCSRNLKKPQEFTCFMEPNELDILHEELIDDDIKYFKSTDYQVGVSHRSVNYYEHLVVD